VRTSMRLWVCISSCPPAPPRRTTYTVCGNAPYYTVFIYTTIFRVGLDWLVSVLFRGSVYWSPGGEVMDFFVVYEVLKKYFY